MLCHKIFQKLILNRLLEEVEVVSALAVKVVILLIKLFPYMIQIELLLF